MVHHDLDHEHEILRVISDPELPDSKRLNGVKVVLRTSDNPGTFDSADDSRANEATKEGGNKHRKHI